MLARSYEAYSISVYLKKKTRRKPVIEVSSRGTSSLVIDPEPVHAYSKEDENSEVPLLSRSLRTKGSTVITMKVLPVEVSGG